MRSHSANHFTIDDLKDIAAICREHGIKSYLTVNTIIYGEDIGNMLHGFMMGAVSSTGGHLIDSNAKFLGKVGKITANAVLSGTVSELGGGKFANGAITGAYSIMFNDMMHRRIKKTTNKEKYLGQFPSDENIGMPPSCFVIESIMTTTIYDNGILEVDLSATGWNTETTGDVVGNFEGELVADGKVIQTGVLTPTKDSYFIDHSMQVNFIGQYRFTRINMNSYKNISLIISGNWVVYYKGLGAWVPTIIGSMGLIPINHSHTYKIK